MFAHFKLFEVMLSSIVISSKFNPILQMYRSERFLAGSQAQAAACSATVLATSGSAGQAVTVLSTSKLCIADRRRA